MKRERLAEYREEIAHVKLLRKLRGSGDVQKVRVYHRDLLELIRAYERQEKKP